MHDPDEPPLANVTISLYCLDENGTALLIETTTTDANGQYAFNDVQPGQCYIQVTPDDPYVFSPVVDGGNQIYPNGTSPIVNITYDDDQEVGVGMYQPVSIGDKVFEDLNGNGIQDAGENGLVGVNVTLVDGSGAAVAPSTFTFVDGSYMFTDLPPGEYGVRFEIPA